MTTDLDIKGYASLSSDVNKAKRDGTEEKTEGVVSSKTSELTLEMSNEDIVKLTDQWESDWNNSPKKQEWQKQIDENEKYWLGKQGAGEKIESERAESDNLIFESLETYLPQATRRNPEPLVTLDASEKDENGNEKPEHQKYVLKVKNRLADLADKNKLRLKLKKGARHWAIFHLGVAKFGWDLDKDIPIARIIRPHRVILDPEATIDEDGYTGDRVGEYRKMSASKILKLIEDNPENKEATEARKLITEKVGDKMDTKIQFIEWWTPQYFCWKLEKTILLKKKNPHWNYDKTETPAPTDLASEGVQVDDYGNAAATETTIQGINHFLSPQMPYVFLSVFNLGDRPMDNTSLIQQNLSNQDRINKRNAQIDNNADDMNSGIVVSLAKAGLTQPQAKNVVKTLRKGGAVAIPDGIPREAIDRYPAPALPPDIFAQLADTRNRLRDIFGVRGTSTAGLESEDTVRGKIVSRSLDSDRIGGGVTEFLEQHADDIYNWFVQLLYVYDTGFQFVPGAKPPKIVVSVKEGSLLPKDSTSIANQALELAKMNRISNLDLYKRLEYPNPEELAANVWLEVNAPHLLYKDNPLIQEALMMAAQAAAQAEEVKMKNENREVTMKREEQQNDLKKEEIKANAKQGGQRSILSAVPANAGALSGP
jgi:hypothetical protein